MTGSILPYDYTENLEVLLRKNKSRTASSSATPSAIEPVTPHHPLLRSWPSCSASSPSPLLPMFPLGPLSTLVTGTSNSALATSRWCMQAHFMACQARMQTLTSNTSWIFVAPSVCLLPCGEGETMVLRGPGSDQHVGQMYHGHPRETFPHGQNPYPKGENF